LRKIGKNLMLVSCLNIEEVISHLQKCETLAIDVETTGLRAYHGDQIFSIIISSGANTFYFNFNDQPDHLGNNPAPTSVLFRSYAELLRPVFEDPKRLWFTHKAQMEMHFLGACGFELKGTIHCTMVNARVEYNDYMKYDLDSCLKRIDLVKDDSVKKYIIKNKLSTKKDGVTYLHFDKVPLSLMVPYGLKDAEGCFYLGMSQIKSIKAQDDKQPQIRPKRAVENIMINERRLSKTIYNMERQGVLVDLDYCRKALNYEDDKRRRAELLFERETSRKYSSSSKLFAEVFADEKDKWVYTEKNNPSFTSEVLATFSNPLAGTVLTVRDAKSKCDFYSGFLYHADKSGVIHTNYNSHGAVHGRFSSSEPNLQNLTKEDPLEKTEEEFIVRRVFVPRPGFYYLSLDYDAMEYRFALDSACRLQNKISPLAELILAGHDVHTATVMLAKKVGIDITRKEAKVANFLNLYGGGVNALSQSLKCSIEKAQYIRRALFLAAPELETYKNSVSQTAKERGYIINWLGRRCYFSNSQRAYKAPNYHTSGGCADVVKVAMNRLDDLLLKEKSKMSLMIHDELVFEIANDSRGSLPDEIKDIMEGVFPSQYLPLTVGMSWSDKSLGDLVDGRKA
jgi:DNA polymerase-1